MVVVKWSDKVEGSGDNLYAPLCVRLYREEDDSLVPCSQIDPDAKMNSFTWSKEDNDWILPGDQYNEEFKNWQGHIYNGQFRLKILKVDKKIEGTCTKCAGSTKLNGTTK